MVSLQTALLALVLSGASNGDPVLLDFYADWCGPCQQMDPVVRQLIAAGYPIRRINFDQNHELATRYGVDRLPSFVMVVDGKVVARQVGPTSSSQLASMCKMGQSHRPQPSRQAPPSQLAATPAAGDNSLPLTPVNSPQAFSPERPDNRPSPNLTSLRMNDAGAKAVSDRDLIFASVRLRIEDTGGQSCGTGTIIDARQGEALILTCGHIFRDSKGKGRISVDLFGPTPVENIPGRVVCYDATRDVGLLSIRVPGPVVAARVAPPGYRVSKGDRVINVGCNNGEPATARHASITAIDKYMAPPNLEVSGEPVQGRSGGGLFAENGLLIGVCNAADPRDHEGYYAAIPSIHEELDRAKLSYVYQPTANGSGAAALASAASPAMPKRMPQVDATPLTPGPVPADNMVTPASALELVHPLSPEERDALYEIQRRKTEGAEVLCIIRPADPKQRSEVIMLDKASPAFMQEIAAAARSEDPRRLTSMDRRNSPPAAQTPAPATIDNLDALAKPLAAVLESTAKRPPQPPMGLNGSNR